MQSDVALERFKQFKSMFISTNMSNHTLLDMIENFITSSTSDDMAVERIPVLDGQLSLFEAAA